MKGAVRELRKAVVIEPRSAPEIVIRLEPEAEESLRKLGCIE
jgi:hypothetical protein